MKPYKPYRKPYGWHFVAIVGLVGLDQLSKFAIVSLFTSTQLTHFPVSFFMDFVLVENTGIAYGLMSGHQWMSGLWLSLVGLLICGILIYLLTKSQTKLAQIGVCLLLGGGLGNIIDRIRMGYVIDFISLHYNNYYWYVFNVADIFLTIGVGLLLLEISPLRNKNPFMKT